MEQKSITELRIIARLNPENLTEPFNDPITNKDLDSITSISIQRQDIDRHDRQDDSAESSDSK